MTYLTLRQERVRNFRRLEVDAARRELREAQAAAARAKGVVRISRAELGRLEAERTAGRATGAEVTAARAHAQTAQREAKAAAAAVRARRAQLSAARAMLPHAASDPTKQPLARLMAEHDAVTARWIPYETDPAKLIAFPAMSDARVPSTAAFLAEQSRAQAARPESATTRIGLTQYTEYRDAVHGLERAFAVAEAEAWRLAGADGSLTADAGASPSASETWTATAQQAIARSASALTRAAEVAAAAYERARELRQSASGSGPATGDDTGREQNAGQGPHQGGPASGRAAPVPGGEPASRRGAPTPGSRPGQQEASTDAPVGPPDGPPAQPVWPVPARTDRRTQG